MWKHKKTIEIETSSKKYVYSIAVNEEDFAVAMTCWKLFSSYDAISNSSSSCRIVLHWLRWKTKC